MKNTINQKLSQYFSMKMFMKTIDSLQGKRFDLWIQQKIEPKVCKLNYKREESDSI